MVEFGAPGATLTIRGASTETYVSGVADLSSGRPIEATDQERVGAVTTTMVATLALQFFDAGRLDIDSPVNAYVPDLMPPGYDGVTVREVMNHTSGLVDYRNSAGFWRRLARGAAFRPEALVSFSTEKPLEFQPGTDYHYVLTNQVVLGLVVRAVGGEGIRQQLTDKIFDPLGLTTTSFPVRRKTIHGPHAHGYVRQGDGEMWDATE